MTSDPVSSEPRPPEGGHLRFALINALAAGADGPGNSPAEAAGPVRVAFCGRTSTQDQQDPTLSLPRQLRASREALPAGMVIVAYFYDVESGRTDLAARGHGRGHERFDIPIPRDGGINDMLDESKRVDRRFDAVICESVERVARRTYYGTLIEHELEQAGVPLLASDEPIVLSGRRATQVLTRRVKQGVAEWYVLDMLEKSRGGLEAHTEEGFNIGKPPYGWAAARVPHPVPARRAEGKHKARLVPDPATAPAVQAIFAWRVGLRLGYKAIAVRLNAQLDRYPPPEPTIPERRTGHWTQSSVREVLHNPKHTGFMVYNRRASKSGNGKVNPVAEWVWSSKPTHDALVSREMFLAAWTVGRHTERSRSGNAASAHPQTRNTYRLRSYVFHVACGRRMFGKTRYGHPYLVCEPGNRATLPADHPTSLWVRESDLLDGLSAFFAERIYGPHRAALLAEELTDAASEANTERHHRITTLRAELADINNRRRRLMHSLETTDDPTGEFTRDIQQRAAELRTEHDTKTRELRDLENTPLPAPVPALLAHLPTKPPNLARLPDDLLRTLLDAFRLTIKYDKITDTARCSVTVSADTLPTLLGAIQQATQHRPRSGTSTRRGTTPVCDVPPDRVVQHRHPMPAAVNWSFRPASRSRWAALASGAVPDDHRTGAAAGHRGRSRAARGGRGTGPVVRPRRLRVAVLVGPPGGG